jgi:TolA-binding protein
MATKIELQNELENRMRGLKSQIETLSQKLEHSGEEARKEIEQSLEDVKLRNKKAEQQFKEVSQASDEVLNTMAHDIETYWGALTGAVENVFLDDMPKAEKAKATVHVKVDTNVPSSDDVHEKPDTSS